MSLVLALAAAGAELPPICTDRPAKANSVCTVPAGRLQVEGSFAAWSITKVGGVRASVLAVVPTTVKLGLGKSSDLQLSVTPYAKARATDAVWSGVGDTVVRYKQRLTKAEAPVQVGVIPFIKFPTAARGLGNGKVEGGFAVPISFALVGPVTMTLGPEADFLADGDGSGRHVAVVNLVNVAGPVAPRLTLAVELWSNLNFDSFGTIRQASADIAFAYAVSNTVQLDAGVNFGLTRETADAELYAGISSRF